MSQQRAHDLAQEFLRLPPEEREAFVAEVRDAVDPVPNEIEIAILVRRDDELERGVNVGRVLDEVLDDLERQAARSA